jgi:hypothetical protein
MPAGRSRWLPFAAMCLVLASGTGGLAGCSGDKSDTGASGTASQSQASDGPKTPLTATAGRLPTLSDYLKQNDISQTVVKRGDAGAPAITLPALPGWQDAGAGTPPSAYGAMVNTDPAFRADPPSIVVIMAKLTDADPAEILKLAPNEIRNLPEFRGGEARPGKLANFDSIQIGGTYVRDGKARIIAQKTVVIPGKDGLYVMQLNADGTKDAAPKLGEATEAIDKAATITP